MSSTFVQKTRPRIIREKRQHSAAAALEDFAPGCNLFILTHGQFSLIDALVCLSQKIGPCRLSVCTWTAGAEDLTEMAGLLSTGAFTDVRWLVDRSFINRQPAYCARLRELFGDDCIRTARSHAKFMTLRNEDFSLAVRSSMNLNFNPRLENLEISDDVAFADFLDAEFDRYFVSQQAGIFSGDLRERLVPEGARAGTVKAQRLFAKRSTANG